MLLNFTDIYSILSDLLDLFSDPVTLNNCFYIITSCQKLSVNLVGYFSNLLSF